MSLPSTCHRIAQGAIVRVSMPTRHRVGVLRGRVWATASGNPHDYVLGPGESVVIEGHDLVIEALDESCVSVEDASAPRVLTRPTPRLRHA